MIDFLWSLFLIWFIGECIVAIFWMIGAAGMTSTEMEKVDIRLVGGSILFWPLLFAAFAWSCFKRVWRQAHSMVTE